jgi:Holliday junction DNA helicase RuvA
VHLDDEVSVFIRSITRDDGTTLFGFAEASERQCFDQLRTVQGVGPNLSIAIVASLGVREIYRFVHQGAAEGFRSVSGVGARLSERIVLEMKRFVPDELPQELSSGHTNAHGGGSEGTNRSNVDDIREALLGLGFSTREIASIEDELTEVADVSEAIRLALRRLSR